MCGGIVWLGVGEWIVGFVYVEVYGIVCVVVVGYFCYCCSLCNVVCGNIYGLCGMVVIVVCYYEEVLFWSYVIDEWSGGFVVLVNGVGRKFFGDVYWCSFVVLVIVGGNCCYVEYWCVVNG